MSDATQRPNDGLGSAKDGTRSLPSPSIPEITLSSPDNLLHREASSSMRFIDAVGYDGESEPLARGKSAHAPTLHTSRSTPGLSTQLTTKLSNTLLHNNTVVHRPRLHSRPTLLDVDPNQGIRDGPDIPVPSRIMSDAASYPSTQPSSITGSSMAPLSLHSTAPTSIVSSGAPRSADTTQRGEKQYCQISTRGSPFSETTTEQLNAQWLVFPRQDAPRLANLSIATVEKAAGTKIFLESHFNALLSVKITPRSMRRRNMERKLFAMAVLNEERHQKRQEWYRAEGYHLRQTRVLKSQTLARQSMKGVHVSNYDIVRVLGKGSFGVVRLVREKSQTSNHTNNSGLEHLKSFDGTSQLDTSTSLRPQEKKVYAMKVIRKSDMLRNSQEGHLRAERDFLVASENCRWVVPLIASFQDNNNLYLVMEYMVGGDFLGLLLREDILDETVARWYIAEMILCIDEAHKMNWIHRDIKPDNFLITASGHLKISDFGLAFDGHWTHNQTYYNEQRYNLLRDLDLDVQGDAQDCAEEQERQESHRTLNLIDGRLAMREKTDGKHEGPSGPILDWLNRTQRRQFAKSVVGTSQYMAPEVIRGEYYDGRCDWWSIGIILYEVCSTSHPTGVTGI
jgi:serine/threonine protein kinase